MPHYGRVMSKTASKGALTLAINAEGKAPTEILLLPAGPVEGRDGRNWVNDNPEAIVAAFNSRGMPLVIDYEHGSELTRGEPAKAAGYAHALKNIEGEIWAQEVEWTEAGGTMVANREYRFISPVFYHDTSGSISRMGSVALTHKPNLDLKALNRESQTDDPEPETPSMDKEQRIALCRELGLADEASDASILAAVTAMKDEKQKALNKAAEPDLSSFVPRADYDKVAGERDKALNTIKEQQTATVEATVDAAIKEGKISPDSRDFHIMACNTENGLTEFKKMVKAAPKMDMAQKGGTAGDPPTGENKALNAEEQALCEQLDLTPDEFIKQREDDKKS